MLNNLTYQHEKKQQTPWSINDAPEKYIKRMLPAIVGLEVDVTSITGQWKVSQNQPVNKQGVVKGLYKEQETDALNIADLIKNHINRAEHN